MGLEPLLRKRQAGRGQVSQHVGEILGDEVRQHEPVVQRRAPADHRLAIGTLPEPGHQRPHQQLLRQTHPRVRRHFERAELDQSQATARRVGRKELVDAELGAVGVAAQVGQQMAEDPVHQPRRAWLILGHLAERDLQLVETLVPRFVDSRGLARRSHKPTGKQVGQRGVVVPVAQQARQQVGPAEERALSRRGTAQHQVIAAAGPGVPAVEHELLRPQPGQPGLLVKGRRVADQLIPVLRRLDVDFDHARVGSHLEVLEAMIVRRAHNPRWPRATATPPRRPRSRRPAPGSLPGGKPAA